MPNMAYPTPPADIVPLLFIVAFLVLTVITVLIFLLLSKNDDFRELKAAYQKILTAFEELDEQAKLIVKTDLELNRAQEELDRRLVGLNALQKFAYRLISSQEENDLFQKIDVRLTKDLGFSQALIFTYNEEDKFICRTNIGFDAKKADILQSLLENQEQILTPLRNGTMVSSLSSSQKLRSTIVQLLDCEHFILAPLATRTKLAGLLFVGNRYNAPDITEGDEELISILASQLSQTLENAILFEQLFRSSRLLETKVQDRTKELSRALQDVAEISQKKTEFVSAVSHELRTPLTSIKGYAAILMTGKVGDIPDAVKERLAKINTHSDNLVKLINDLLDIARIESGRVEMKTAPKAVRPMLENINDLLVPQLTAKNLTIKLNLASDMPLVSIDQSQVDRIFINLISNAIKFTPPQGTITINALPRLDHDDVLFEVADTGIGIKKDDLTRIFDEFYRVDNEVNMHVKGTGLGLSLAKNIVEAHGGRIWVTSEPGTGTTFHFTLPLKQSEKVSAKNKLYQGLHE